MKVAFYSPMPPAKSGIADYSATLVDSLRPLVDLQVIESDQTAPAADIALYQLGNNPYHGPAYQAAMRQPGVLVLHEANLHHLIADLTIKQGDWDAYVKAVGDNEGPAALDYAVRFVRTVQRGPQYELPLLRTALQNARGVIVHSDTVGKVVRDQGYTGPMKKILHGAWVLEADRMAMRVRLGLNENTPLIGIFGFLKPYKRIAQALAAFKRLIAVAPEARLILVGEAHPEFPVGKMIQQLGLGAHAQHIDFAPLDEFNAYLAACDIVLNLRYPTVGETSGTLLRALGLGKAVVVSNVGAFAEYPDEIVLKAPVDSSEEEHLYGYLNLLVSRPEVCRSLGARAKAWVDKECNWQKVGEQYRDFLEEVLHPKAAPQIVEPPQEEAPLQAQEIEPGYVTSWAPDADAKSYVETHLTRLEHTLSITPPGTSADSILEMGAYLQITPALKTRLGYGEVRGCYYGTAGHTDKRSVTSEAGEVFECEVDLFDAERDPFPYPDNRFSTVICCELIEHLPTDPMHMMLEVNRIVRPGGYFVVTTPNIVSLRAISGILQGFHPQFFSSYIRPRNGTVDARHAREYTPLEIRQLLENSGFEVTLLETGPFKQEPKPELAWVEHLLEKYWLTKEHRGDGIYAVGRKVGPVRERYPSWLYD